MSDNKKSFNNDSSSGDLAEKENLINLEGNTSADFEVRNSKDKETLNPTNFSEVKEDAAIPQSLEITEESRFFKIVNNPNSPWIVLIVSLIVLLFISNHYWKFINFGNIGAPRVVLFDPVKFMNAQRAAISVLAARPDNDLSFTLTQVAKQAENVILEEADGAVILIKQAVVVPRSMEDITDKVLIRFNLPTDAPTVNVNVLNENSSAFVAPTDYSFSARESQDNYKDELSTHRQKLLAKINNSSNQDKMVP